MSISISARKAKGRNLQKEIVMDLRKKYHLDYLNSSSSSDNCYEGDITARMMGGAGTDVIISPMAQGFIPFDIECKCQQNLNIWSALKQCEANTKEGRVSLLIFKRNNTETYCCLKFKELLRLIK